MASSAGRRRTGPAMPKAARLSQCSEFIGPRESAGPSRLGLSGGRVAHGDAYWMLVEGVACAWPSGLQTIRQQLAPRVDIRMPYFSLPRLHIFGGGKPSSNAPNCGLAERSGSFKVSVTARILAQQPQPEA